jgi:ABC-type branched-subunit amino acid transport system substrate-binding protein
MKRSSKGSASGRARTAAPVAALAAAIALVACSSSPASTAPAATGTTGTTASGSSASPAAAAAGSPIGLAYLTEFSSQGSSGDGYTGVQAAIKYINAHGGVKGHPLIATECTDNDDPNLAAACATKAASNPQIIATAGQTTLQGAVVDPILQHAGLPAIAANTFVSADFTSPDIFTTTLGGLVGLGAVAAATDLLHARKVSFVYVQSPAAATEVSLIDSTVLTPRKLPPMTAVGVSPTTGDMSAAVAKASLGSPGAIIMYAGQAQANSFVKAARQQGVTTPILIAASLESASAVEQQLSGGQNLYFYTWFNHSGPFYDAFASQWQAAGNQLANADDIAINGWLAVTMFADVARTLPAITRASVMQAFSRLSGYTTGGLLPPLSYTKPGTALGGQAPRVINPTMGLSQYQNGTFVPYDNGKFTNPFTVP